MTSIPEPEDEILYDLFDWLVTSTTDDPENEARYWSLLVNKISVSSDVLLGFAANCNQVPQKLELLTIMASIPAENANAVQLVEIFANNPFLAEESFYYQLAFLLNNHKDTEAVRLFLTWPTWGEGQTLEEKFETLFAQIAVDAFAGIKSARYAATTSSSALQLYSITNTPSFIERKEEKSEEEEALTTNFSSSN